QRFIDRLNFRQSVHVRTKIVEGRAAMLVADADAYGFQAAKDVEKRQRDFRGTAKIGGIFDGNRVEPAAAARAAGGGAIFIPALADVAAGGVVLFRRKRPAAHARAVGLHDPDKVADSLRRNAGAREKS